MPAPLLFYIVASHNARGNRNKPRCHRRGGYQPPAWPRCQSAVAERIGPSLPLVSKGRWREAPEGISTCGTDKLQSPSLASRASPLYTRGP